MSYFAHKVNQCRKAPFVFFDLIAQFLKKEKPHASQFCRSHMTYRFRSGPSQNGMESYASELKMKKKTLQ